MYFPAVNFFTLCKAGGSSLENVVKTTILLRNMDDFATVNAIYGRYFPKDPPARATYLYSLLTVLSKCSHSIH